MPTPAVFAIDGVPRDYAWGSPTAIPQLLGRPGDGSPVAELWFGAHPDDPSPVPAHAATLEQAIAADPTGLLGAQVVDEFGPRLPFLLKILAAAKPLSIQVHPTRAQAEAGFDAEDVAGIARDAADRNYRDRNHKPELLCALTEFEALCGFRPIEQTLRLLDVLALVELETLRARLGGQDGLRAAFTYLLTCPDPAPIVTAVQDRIGAFAQDPEWAGAARAVELSAAAFPGDVGIVITLLLNVVRLAPGEAIYLGAGNVHAYLRGTGLEIMANSDNVLRCGLTPKHIDVDEVLAVTDFRALAEPRCPVDQIGLVTWRYRVPVADFSLERIEVGAEGGVTELGGAPAPSILIAPHAASEVWVDGHTVALEPAHAAFAVAGASAIIRSAGTVFRASVGERSA